MIIAMPGDPVTDENGKVICRVKNTIVAHQTISALDFHEFADGEDHWYPGMSYDKRCFRVGETAGPRRVKAQICINGEWRP